MSLDFIQQIVSWLQKRRAINLVLVFAYFIAILLMHGPIAQLSLNLESKISIGTYNIAVEVVYVLILIVVIGVIWKEFKRYPDNSNLKLSYLALTILFVFIHSRFMFDSNIEVIHSLEFTFLVFLIFPFTNRFGAAVFFTLPFMLFDEWYQYIYLYPNFNDYYDLNDIQMDTYGCGLAMALLMIVGVKGAKSVKPLWKRPEFISLVGLVVVILAAVKTGIIAPYAGNQTGNTLLIINERISTEPFFRFHPTHHIMFHTMKPLEGLIAITALHLFYFGMDSFRK